MSLSNIPTTLPSVERIMQRVMAAERAQQKDIRLSIQEAHELAAELAVLSTKLGKTISEIHAMISEIKNSAGPSSPGFDGGVF
jgi:phosphopantetheinyl transferase